MWDGMLEWEKLVEVHTRVPPPPMRSPVCLHPDGTPNVPGTCVNIPGRLSVQETYEPHGSGWGGGGANPHGLQLKSFRTPTGLESRWLPAAHFQGFPGILSGGVVASLFESQGNWTAAIKLMDTNLLRAPPLTTTAGIRVDFLRPIDINDTLIIRSTADAPTTSRTKPNSFKLHVSVRLPRSIRVLHPVMRMWTLMYLLSYVQMKDGLFTTIS